MIEFTLSDLNRRPGELADEALVQPISITKRGRRQLVLLSARAYDELVNGAPAKVTVADAESSAEPPATGNRGKTLDFLRSASMPEEP